MTTAYAILAKHPVKDTSVGMPRVISKAELSPKRANAENRRVLIIAVAKTRPRGLKNATRFANRARRRALVFSDGTPFAISKEAS